MLPFGSTDSHGGPIQDADPEEWAKHLRLVRRIGFTEVDPTDTWVRVADLDAGAAGGVPGRAQPTSGSPSRPSPRPAGA